MSTGGGTRAEDEGAAKSSTTAAASGVRRLRDELNAVSLDQQRQHATILRRCTRHVDATSSRTSHRGVLAVVQRDCRPAPTAVAKAAAWSDLGAALASLKFHSCAAAAAGSRSLRGLHGERDRKADTRHGRQSPCPTPASRITMPSQVAESAKRGFYRPPTEPETRLAISHKYLTLWRDMARAAVVARHFSRRAVSHRRESTLRHAFLAWQLHWRGQQNLHLAYRAAVSKSSLALTAEVYRRWRRAFRFTRALRGLKELRRVHLLHAVLLHWQPQASLRRCLRRLRHRSQARTARCVWRRWWQYIRVRHLQIDQYRIAHSFFLRCQWKTLVEQAQRRQKHRRLLDRHLEKQRKQVLAMYFDGWLEFIEWRKRCQLGVKWYQQRLVEVVLDGWKTALERAHYVATIEKRARKKMARYRLHRCLQQWRSSVRYLRHRADQLKQVPSRLVLRRALWRLYRFSVFLLQRERDLQLWKSRRALRTWIQRTDARTRTSLRGAMVAEMRSISVKRVYGWAPWRLAYRRITGTRILTERRRLRELRQAWDALETAIAEQRRLESIMTLASAHATSRRLGTAVSTWADFTYASQVCRRWKQTSSSFHEAALKRKSFNAWCQSLRDVQRLRTMHALADELILMRALRRWRRRADRLRRERLHRIDAAERLWKESLARKCMTVWLSHAQHQQFRLRQQAFASWSSIVRLQKTQRAFIALARPLNLQRYWFRWIELVRHNLELEERARHIRDKHERRVKHAFLIEKWLFKARRYHRARLVIRRLDCKASCQRSLMQWKLWNSSQRRKRQAIEFYEHSVMQQCLLKLCAATVGLDRIARSYCNHQRLRKVWRRWLVLWNWSKLGKVADKRFRHSRLSRALSSLHANTSRKQQMRVYQQLADVWRRNVILQTGLAHLHFTAQKLARLRRAQEHLQWHIVGARHFRAWRFMCAMQQKAREAHEFYRHVQLQQSFNRWLQITKRRLVSVAMWRYAMTRIRSAHAFAAWKTHVTVRRRVRLGIEVMHRRRHEQMLHRCFSQWDLMVVVAASHSICLRRSAERWAGQCLLQWRRFLVIQRTRRERRSHSLRSSLARLRQFASQQQVTRHLRRQSARAAQGRALHVWHVEFLMARAQRAVSRALLRQCFHDWARYAAGCRQQRQWIRYVQQLHKIHEVKGKAETFEARREKPRSYISCVSETDEWSRRRDLQGQVLHAWFLATKSCRRRRYQGRISSEPVAPRSRDAARAKLRSLKTTTRGRRRAQGASNRVLALRFWSEHLVSRAFRAWSDHYQSKRVLQ